MERNFLMRPWEVRIARYQMLQLLLLHENLVSIIHFEATIKDLMVDATAQGGWPEYELVNTSLHGISTSLVWGINV